MFLRSVPVSLGLIALAACSSGTVENINRAADKDSAFVAQYNSLASGFGFANTAFLPTTGTAQYDGYLRVSVDDADDTVAIGDLTLTADFATDRVTGEADDFLDSEGRDYSGTLNVSNGLFGNVSPPGLSSGAGFTADIDGTLTTSETGQNDVDGRLSGIFTRSTTFASRPTGVIGIVSGTVENNNGTFGIEGNFSGR